MVHNLSNETILADGLIYYSNFAAAKQRFFRDGMSSHFTSKKNNKFGANLK